MVTITNHVISGRIYIARGSWYFEDFCNIFQPNIGKDQKSLTTWVLGPGTISCGNSGPGNCITFIKGLNEGLR